MATELRTRFVRYLTLRNFSPKTKEAYIHAVIGLAGHYRKSPDQLDNDQIQEYLNHLITERRLAWSTVNVAFSAYRCFYRNVLEWDAARFSIPPRKKPRQFPMLLSEEEVKALLQAPANLKHQALLTTVYGAGLRVSEVVCLQPHHIESSRMMIRVEQGKGQKDRYTILPQSLLELLRRYWKECRPDKWLFFGRDRQSPMPIDTAQRIYYQAKDKAGITKGRGIHTLRHCFATHMLDHGTDIHTIKHMLGHGCLKTTTNYIHVTQEGLRAVKSPLDF